MYVFEDMIDMGLKDNQEWPSDAHRVVASNVALCNSLVVNRDTLTEICQAVIAIPADQIKTVTYADLASKYNVPCVRLS